MMTESKVELKAKKPPKNNMKKKKLKFSYTTCVPIEML